MATLQGRRAGVNAAVKFVLRNVLDDEGPVRIGLPLEELLEIPDPTRQP